ncbi:MAG: HAD-IIA family hydrolase [Gemmatimonadota bacterium]
MGTIEALLIDLDGTLYVGNEPIPGALEAMHRLDRLRMPYLFTTNTSRKSRAAVVEALTALGLEVEPAHVLTAPVAAARWLRREGIRTILPLLPASTHEDLAGFELVGTGSAPQEPGRTHESAPEQSGSTHESARLRGRPEAVVVGDLGRGFTFERLNEAFLALRAGARLVAVHKNRFWITEEGPTLDAGPFVVGLEYAARVDATLVGKPAPAFFELAAEILGRPADRLAVVGDDAESDVQGARAAGLTAIQVETGKFDPVHAERAPAGERPHHRIASIAELPALLDRLA